MDENKENKNASTSYLIDPNTMAILLQVEDERVIESEMQQYFSIVDKVTKAGVLEYMNQNGYDEDEKELIRKKMDTYISTENIELKTDEMLKTFLAKPELQEFLAVMIEEVNKGYYAQYYPALSEEKKGLLADYIFESKQLEKRAANHLLNLLDLVDDKKIEEELRQEKEKTKRTPQQNQVVETPPVQTPPPPQETPAQAQPPVVNLSQS